MTTRDAALAHTREAMRHLTDDGLPAYPPPKPWPHAPAALSDGELWVFGYGSLIWNPGFPHAESHTARLYGYHRRLCVWSWEYRGTAERPGLVLGLDRGGSCHGVAFRVAERDKAATVAYLMRRELTTLVYRPLRARVCLADRRRVYALTFVVDPRQHQYAGHLQTAELVSIVSRAIGGRGANREYVINTYQHLVDLGIPCPRLTGVVNALGRC